jgi:hypothetical protein
MSVKSIVKQKQEQGVPTENGPCPVHGCKTKPVKYGFCSTHFDHFKFGLITKAGVPVSDFDKKFDAYMRLQGKLKAA